MLDEIPLSRPETPLLDQIQSPAHLKDLDIEKLSQLADELRLFLLYSVGKTGGHFGAGLGVVELTIALHYVFNTPADHLVWDVAFLPSVYFDFLKFPAMFLRFFFEVISVPYISLDLSEFQ